MGNITVGVAAVQIYGHNPSRAGLTLRNESTGGQIIGFSFTEPNGLTITNRDYVLRPQEEKNFIFDEDGVEMRGQVSAVSDLAGAILVRAETNYKLGDR